MESTIGLALGWCGFSSQDGVGRTLRQSSGPSGTQSSQKNFRNVGAGYKPALFGCELQSAEKTAGIEQAHRIEFLLDLAH